MSWKRVIIIIALAALLHNVYKSFISQTEQINHIEPSITPEWAPMNIIFDVSPLSSANKEIADYLQRKVIPEAQKFFNTLKVYRESLSWPISLNQCQILIPKYSKDSLEGDLLVILATDTRPNIKIEYVAQSHHCAFTPVSKRATVGVILYNLGKFEITEDAFKIKSQISILIHETIHILGFGLQFWWDNKTKESLYPLQKIEKDGKKLAFITAEPLRTYARNYFNCSTLEGMLLENNVGESITAISHFEESISYGEAMTANSANEAVKISMFTLKLLESTGWYQPDYSIAEPFTLGKNKGCGFVYGDKKIRKELTCSEHYDIGCSIDGLGWGQCLINPLMDNIWHYRNDISCEIKWHEIRPESKRLTDKGYYGEGGRCFYISSERNKAPLPLCLKQECEKIADKWILKVSQGDQKAICKKKGKVPFSGLSLHCPDPEGHCSQFSMDNTLQ